jgi:hypothetical protein
MSMRVIDEQNWGTMMHQLRQCQKTEEGTIRMIGKAEQQTSI